MGRERDMSTDAGDEMIREGDVVFEERMNRRDGLVEYEGTTGGSSVPGGDDLRDAMPSGEMTGDRDQMSTGSTAPGGGLLGGAMQAGASVFDSASSQPDSSVTTGDTGGMSSGGGISGMSNDNTGSGGMDSSSSNVLSRVQEKMKVVDANGDDIGKVDYVAMGDPQAVTTAGQEDMAPDSITGNVAQVFGGGTEPDVPEPFRSELLREGFIKVDGKGWFGSDHYLRASDIANVTGDGVRLRVTKDALPGGNS